MSLRMAVLAILEAKPMTGYELAKFFDHSIAHIWQASHSQIYPELKKLEREGLIEAKQQARGNLATKSVYAVMPAGGDELERWANQVVPPLHERSPELLKVMYQEWASYQVAEQQFEAHRVYYLQLYVKWAAHAEDLRLGNTDLMRHRLKDASAEASAAVLAYKVHVYEGLLERAQMEIDWATKGIALVERLLAEAGTPPGHRAASPSSARRR
ncbi:PadR family transcriptional regulator [Paenarthrobacter nitroguajacolicus]|uniref:PadR family transcriptional regulator n=1 Tax=Paenarthrobacter nitroguajacolicus TaxID=211146 RepID=UPI0015BAC59C